MIRAKAKNRELEDASQALNDAIALVTLVASPPAEPQYRPRSTWRYPQPQVIQGLTRFMNIPSPPTYVIEISDGEDDDMEDLEV